MRRQMKMSNGLREPIIGVEQELTRDALPKKKELVPWGKIYWCRLP